MAEDTKVLGRRAVLARLLAAPLLLIACGREQREPAPATSPPRTIATLIPVQPAPTNPDQPIQPTNPGASAPQDTGWVSGEQGIELRHLRVPVEQAQVPLVLVRCDPAIAQVRVSYDPEKPRLLRSWFTTERPILAINGGYFAEDYQSTALVVQNGVASGESYQGFGGMLAVHTDGSVELRPLRDAAYDSSEPLLHATQSSPMLVFPGGVAAALEEDGQRARRSAIAIDQQGRLLFIVGPTSGLTLLELATWLASSDLSIDRALNLDGGSSTGLFLASGKLSEAIDSFSPLPIVILAGRQP